MSKPQAHIAAMSPYALSQMVAPLGKPLISLSQNESLRAPSPLAIAAAAKAAQDGALYPDPECRELRTALADLHGLDPDKILCGSGSLDLIGCLARVYAGPTRAVLAPAHAYPFFKTAAQMAGARFDTADEAAATVNVDALLRLVQPDTGIVFVANPGNPTGTRISIAELRRLRAGLRADIILVIDEAYGEFADHLQERAFDMIAQGNTLVLRTFSKAYGLAGFRVGWGYVPSAIAGEMRKVMNPNAVALASQAAAVAAVKDQAYMRETCALTADLRDRVSERLSQMGFKAYPSLTNFVLIDLGDAQLASRVDMALRAQGIFLRGQVGAGLPQCLRMTIGPEEDLAVALAVLDTFKAEEN